MRKAFLALALTLSAGLVIALPFVFLAGSTMAQQSNNDTQGICKGDTVPYDSVIVREWESSRCDPPGTKNAWDTAQPTDGIQVCIRPDLLSAAGNVLELTSCEEIRSDACPLKLDGSMNAIVLRSPEHCVTPKKLRTACMPLAPSEIGPNEFVIGEMKVAQGCNPMPRNQDQMNAVVLLEVENREQPFVTCTGVFGEIYMKPFQPHDVIVRRFHSRYCFDWSAAKQNTTGQLQLNAIAVYTITKRPPPQLTLCYGTPLVQPPGQQIDRNWPLNWRDEVYDPKCGGPGGRPNGARITHGNSIRNNGQINPLQEY